MGASEWGRCKYIRVALRLDIRVSPNPIQTHPSTPQSLHHLSSLLLSKIKSQRKSIELRHLYFIRSVSCLLIFLLLFLLLFTHSEENYAGSSMGRGCMVQGFLKTWMFSLSATRTYSSVPRTMHPLPMLRFTRNHLSERLTIMSFNIIFNHSLKFFSNFIALKSHCFNSVFINRCDWFFTIAG